MTKDGMTKTRLRVFMAQKGLTPADLVKITEVSAATIYAIVNGNRLGSIFVWEKIQEALEIPDEEMWTVIHE